MKNLSLTILFLAFATLGFAQADRSVENYYVIGQNQYASGNYKESISYLDKAIKLKPDYSDAYLNRGHAKLKAKDLKGANLDYSKAIKLNPSFVEAYMARAILKEKSKDLKGAVKDLTSAIELNPDHSDAYASRGDLKNELKDAKGACSDWKKAEELGDKKVGKSIKKHCK
jgi:tetratricopeptide (TPR) repeat protein